MKKQNALSLLLCSAALLFTFQNCSPKANFAQEQVADLSSVAGSNERVHSAPLTYSCIVLEPGTDKPQSCLEYHGYLPGEMPEGHCEEAGLQKSYEPCPITPSLVSRCNGQQEFPRYVDSYRYAPDYADASMRAEIAVANYCSSQDRELF